jgi:ABC-type phosphate transport system substrate-binding protein
LVTPTYILIAQKPKNVAAGNAVKAWLEWDLQKTQQTEVAKLGYVPLPTKLVALDLAALKTVH